MKTEFSLASLPIPTSARLTRFLRACVHCGFCTATCPTYVLLATNSIARAAGSISSGHAGKRPRADAGGVKHIDRCLSCLSCMTTCPSGVNYMHLVDQARVRVEEEYKRPLPERLLRGVLAFVLPRPGLFRRA